LDVSVAGKQSFTICLNGVKLSRGEVDTCSVLPKKHLYVGRKDLWVGWNDSVARQQLENSFQVNNKLELKVRRKRNYINSFCGKPDSSQAWFGHVTRMA